ncbi:MAG: polyamine ABC transporter ATP-binding protein [Gammaproteobacteria bacterium]|nr:polyamine ABC transporter ATP-binding protein [Gammaproteobacteria bacterium]
MADVKRAIENVEPWNDPQAQPYVRIENVTKMFGEFTAVDSVSLEIYKAEVFCLLGGSGCGKSTLLRVLAGFETPTSGRVLIDGVDMAGIAPYERPTNMMFQSYALFPHMTVENNVAFGLRQEGIAAAEISKRVGDMLDLVKLGPFAKRKPHQLSGGQRQRVALARSLIKQPKLMLLDEPLGALDKKLREETQFELINIQEELGVTFIVVTHDQEEAMTLSSRIGVMNAGEIVQTGTPNDIYEYPNSRFVADFIGSVNVFEGRIVEDQPDHVRIESQEAGCPLYIDHGVGVTSGSRVWVAVRPEKIEITRDKPAQQDNCAAAVVDEIAYMGNQSIYHVLLESGKKLRITRPNQSRTSSDSITWEDQVFVAWHPSSGVVLTA